MPATHPSVVGDVDEHVDGRSAARPLASPTQQRHLSPSPSAACADESIGYLMARVRSTMATEVQQLTQPAFELTATQASMLMMLKSGPKSGAALAREYGIDASAVTRLLDKLEQRALLTRSRSDADRRVVNLALTHAGGRVVEQLQPCYGQVLERMLAGFSEEEAGFLKSLLRRIILNCETSTGR